MGHHNNTVLCIHIEKVYVNRLFMVTLNNMLNIDSFTLPQNSVEVHTGPCKSVSIYGLVDVLMIEALLLRVYIKVPYFWKLPYM